MAEAVDESANLTNLIVTGFWSKLVREGKMLVKNKYKISSRVGGVK